MGNGTSQLHRLKQESTHSKRAASTARTAAIVYSTIGEVATRKSVLLPSPSESASHDNPRKSSSLKSKTTRAMLYHHRQIAKIDGWTSSQDGWLSELSSGGRTGIVQKCNGLGPVLRESSDLIPGSLNILLARRWGGKGITSYRTCIPSLAMVSCRRVFLLGILVIIS